MKILKIDFQNINSLRGEHHIDFTKEPFLQNSLFAITGPTGSGKTTILDVISLALFNHVPRLGKMSTGEILKKGAILTRNQTEAYAQITYRCKEGVFASTWSISTNRNGNLRDYHMEISNVETEAILDLKKSDVPAKNEELIGLNYDQFIKSVVLAQGEFAKFLQVPKKERGALLEKITGTEIYRRIGMEVYLKHKERAKELDLKRAKIETFKEQLIEETVYAEKQQEAEKIASERTKLKKELDALSNEIKLKTELEKQENEHFKTQKQLREAEKQHQKFEEEKGGRLRRHLELQLFAEELNRWLTLREKAAEKAKEITAATEAIQHATTERETLKQEIATSFRLEVSPANFAEKLENYKREVRQLIAERSTIGATYTNSVKHIDSVAVPLNFIAKASKTEAFQSELNEKQALKNTHYKNIAEQFDFQKHSIETLQTATQEQLRQLRLAEKANIQLSNLKTECTKKTAELETITSQQKGLPETIEKITQQLELKDAQLVARQKTLEVENLQKQLDDYRNELKPDVPCPLCGSLEHPFATHLPEQENGLKSAVEHLEQELKILQKEHIEKQAELKQFTQQTSVLNRQIEELNTQLETAQREFDARFKGMYDVEENYSFSAQETRLEKQVNDLALAKKLQDEFTLLQTLKEQIETLNTLIDQGKKNTAAIQRLYSGEIPNFESQISIIETTWNRNEQSISQQQQLLKIAQQTSAEITERLKTLTTSLLGNLQEKGYVSIEKALEQRLNASVAQTWTSELQQLQSSLVRLKTLQRKLSDEIKILKETTGTVSLEKLQEEQAQKNEALTINENTGNELSRILKNQKQNLEFIAQLRNQIEIELEQSKHWQVLFDLIGDATGNKFNDFAQDLTLAQLLQLANKRLVQLTDRYRIDQPTGDEDDSLVAIDEHMGGQRRSIKTLSGGETFILSLALALALSDLASRNIEINSLFIDEGFGTLDPETLDQTLDTLDVLQAESSKMIGVISHVDSLKERIATQIQLTQNGQGYSSLTVV
ncbi:AAA family ATPase [Leeuwenhoekiella sp. MAR_2009_132]|uniref:AAA family ATPase n=1 Tax=Leeuwenhoekiella sp. MAR_2009_132 TaxID=1392489 RepID=UPI00048E3DD2|nr:AAA family ATPase [Leeuwenhoekiella sp. MAR_2009_132]